MRLRWTVTAFAAWAACAADSASRAPAAAPGPMAAPATAPDEPIVGRLKMHDRTIDLTASSFAPGRNDVPREATAMPVMADVDPDTRSGSDSRDASFDRAH